MRRTNQDIALVAEPSAGPPLTDYRMDALRFAEMAPIDPKLEDYEPEGMATEPMTPEPPMGPPPAPPDLRPAIAHTVSYVRRDENGGIRDQLAGQRPQVVRQMNYPPVGGMLPEPLQRNIARFSPGPLRDQDPYTIGAGA